MKCYSRAANKENYEAQLALARMYKHKDSDLAIYWYNKAMVKDPDAASLGLIDVYLSQKNVEQEKIKCLLDNISNKNKMYENALERFNKYISENA